MDKCREEFEQSPKTKELLSDSIYFDEKENRYKVNADGCLITVVFLNGRWEVWQEQQAKVEELQKQAEIDSQLIQLLKKANKDLVGERDDLINKYNEYDKLLFQRNKDEQKLYDMNEKHVAEKGELQKRVDKALKETQYALQYVEEDMRGNHEFLQMAMIRAFKELEKVLNGGEPK
ncbi:hypothetical protein V8P49_01805 [Acinetobacter baumannii]